MNIKYKASFFIVSAALILYALCSMLPAPLYAQGTITYVENFSDNSNGWWVGENNEIRAEIKNGKYMIERKTDKVKNTIDITWKPWFFWPKSRVKIDQNRLFRIDSNMRLLGGSSEDEFGVVLGATDGASYYRFFIASNGKCGQTFYSGKSGQHTILGNCPVNKGRVVNKISPGRIDDGSGMAYILNEKLTGRMPFQAFQLSDFVGLHLDGQMAVEVDDFKILVASHEVPTSWEVMTEGNFKSRFVWPPEAQKLLSITAAPPPQFKGEVHNGGHLTLNKSVPGDNITAGTTVKAPVNTQGSVIGVYIQTEDGGMLKLERVDTPKGIVARFSAVAGGKEMGSKEVAIPASEAHLKMTRQKDAFRGEVTIDGKTAEVGSLNWPNLAAKQLVGVLATYKDSAPNARQSITYEFTNFTAGGPGLAARQPAPAPASPETAKYVAEEKQARTAMKSAQGMQFWLRLGMRVVNNKFVAAVLKNSPAERAGIIRDDLILKVNGKPVDEAELSKILTASGTPVELVIQRAGRELTINVQRERPFPPPPSAAPPPPPPPR